jgi:hypothetical protein
MLSVLQQWLPAPVEAPLEEKTLGASTGHKPCSRCGTLRPRVVNEDGCYELACVPVSWRGIPWANASGLLLNYLGPKWLRTEYTVMGKCLKTVPTLHEDTHIRTQDPYFNKQQHLHQKQQELQQQRHLQQQQQQ